MVSSGMLYRGFLGQTRNVGDSYGVTSVPINVASGKQAGLCAAVSAGMDPRWKPDHVDVEGRVCHAVSRL